MNIDQMLSYVIDSPCDTNPRVLGSMIESYKESINDFYKNSPSKEDDYLYRKVYDSWDYNDADKYMHNITLAGHCSSIRVGNYIGRNYDWYYDNAVSFIINCDASNYVDRHSSYGVASLMNLTKDMVETGDFIEQYTYLPFLTLDGINDVGVYANTNVVPTDHEITEGTNPGGRSLNVLEAVRFILDYADSADDAIEKMKKINWYSSIGKSGYEIHIMICDANKTYVVEFMNNKMKVVEEFVDNIPIMTNFFLNGFDGTKQSLTPFGAGFERYEILAAGAENVTSLDSMKRLMASVYFTKSYDEEEDPAWYTDFVGHYSFGDLTTASPEEDFASVMEKAREFYKNRDRSIRNTWQTVHTSVYDLSDWTSGEISTQEQSSFITLKE